MILRYLHSNRLSFSTIRWFFDQISRAVVFKENNRDYYLFCGFIVSIHKITIKIDYNPFKID